MVSVQNDYDESNVHRNSTSFVNLTITKHSGREQYEVHKMLLRYVNIHLKTIELLKITLQKEHYNAKVSLQYVVCMSEYSHI